MVGSQPASPAASPRRLLPVWVSLWGIFVTNVTLTILTIALPQIAEDLAAPPAVVNWVTLGPMLVLALLTPAAGRAADSFGRKRIWVGGFSVAILGMAASGVAPELYTLLAARVLTGVGTAVMLPASMAIATQDFEPEERATPVGYVTGTLALSPMFGVLIGGWVIEHVSWRWLFAGQIALALPALLAALVVFREQRYPVEGRFDMAGSIQIGGASLALMLAATLWPQRGLADVWTLLSVALTVALCLWAIRTEHRADNPVLPPHILRDPQIAMSLLARLALNAVYMGAFITLPYLLMELWHMPPFDVSTTLLPRPLAMGLTGPLVGRLAQRFGAGRLVAIGAAGIVLSTAMFMQLGLQPQRAWLITALVIAGTSLALTVSGTGAVAAARVGASELGTVGGLMTLTATLANVLGMAVLFACVESFGGAQEPAAYRAAFGVGLAVAAAGLLAALRLWLLERAETTNPVSAT